jgi:hypothetical protein
LRCVEILSVHTSSILKIQLAEAYNTEIQEERVSHPHSKHISLIERLYMNNLKLPINYLDRKHPTYMDNNPEQQEPFRIEKINHKSSIIMREESPKFMTHNMIDSVKDKAMVKILDELDSRLQNKPQSVSDYILRDKEYEKLSRVKFESK